MNEQRSHFALWALLKAPLMVGADLSKLSAEGFKILLAKEVIAVNQDKLGVAGDLVSKTGPAEVGRPLHFVDIACDLNTDALTDPLPSFLHLFATTIYVHHSQCDQN